VTATPPSNPLALIVDDDMLMRLLAREALEGAGWEVEEAENGREAVAAVERLRPSVILMDVMMPEMNGFAACTAIHRLPEGENIPIVIMTGLNDYGSIEQAYEAGATDFLTKPLNGLLLRHRVRYIVRSSQIAQELRANQAILAQARDVALEGTRLKSEFLSTVSHELRTPMNGILGMVDLLLDTPLTPDQQDLADSIRTSGDQLLSVINNVLDFTEAESGRLILSSTDFETHALLHDVLTSFMDIAQRKGIAIATDMHPSVPARLRGDQVHLRRILRTLLDNAVKFTKQGTITIGVNTVEASCDENPLADTQPNAKNPMTIDDQSTVMLRFSVADTGIGIPSEAHKWIFQPFRQSDGSNARQYGGTGLGLAICKQLVERMGGTIEVVSTLGQGSTFHVTLPFTSSYVLPSCKTDGTTN